MNDLQDNLKRLGNTIVSGLNQFKSVLNHVIENRDKISKKAIKALALHMEKTSSALNKLAESQERRRERSGVKPALAASQSRQQQAEELLNFARRSDGITRETSIDLLRDGDPASFTVEYRIDTSDRANVVFKLGDPETSEMFLQLKREADSICPGSILMNETGYKLLSRMEFVGEKSVALFNVLFERKNLSFNDVHSRLSNKNIEYGGELTLVRFMYSVNERNVGGCSDYELKPKIKLGGSTVRLFSPKSKDNNCAFMCYIKFLKLNGSKVKPVHIRKKLGFPLGSKISLDDLTKISDHFGIGHVVWNGDHKIIDQYALEREKHITLYLEFEHFSYVKDFIKKKKCEKCGREFQSKHDCNNISRQVYFQTRTHPDGKIWEVPPVDRFHNGEEDLNKLVFWDTETFTDTNGKHLPYAVGWKTEGKYFMAKGESCMDEFLEFILQCPNKIFISYNGARFDHYFIYQKMMKRGISFTDKDITNNNGRILFLQVKDKDKHIIFRDLYQFMPGFSLKKACESFGCNVAKGDFDHKLIHSWQDVETHSNGWSPYLKLDVDCLEELYSIFSKNVYQITKFHVSDFITLSQMGFTNWKTSIPEKVVERISDQKKRDLINQSVYGGRCYPLQKEWKSPYYDAIKSGKMSYEDLKKTRDGFIFNADATSLYPASMNNHEYPIGLARWSENPKEDFESGKLGIFKVLWDCPNKKLRVPVLPVRGCSGLDQTLQGREGVYNSIDIRNAMSCGYTFQFLDEALVWDETSTTLFNDYTQKWFDIKKQESGDDGNKALRQIAKLFMNSLYGKMLQGEQCDAMTVCGTIHDFWRFQKVNKITDWLSVENNDGSRSLVLFGINNTTESKPGKPRHLGSFIVGYSKQIMLNYMKQIDPKLESCVFTYHDTDSLHIFAESYHKLLAKGLIMDSDNSDLGMLCNDIKGDGLIIYEKNLGAKNYTYEYINNKGEIKTEYKCKGIMKKNTLGDNEDVLTPELYESEEAKPLEYHSFKKIMRPTKRQQELGLTTGDIQTIVNSRTFNKVIYNRMILYKNNYYPNGYDFSALENKCQMLN